jgi:hypothetical protein
MSIERLELRLEAIRRKMEEFLETRGPEPDWGNRFRELCEELYSAEREVAKVRGGEYAVPCDLGVSWDTGAPMPHLLKGSYRTFLIFILRESNPAWDGTSVNIVDPSSGAVEPLALVEFECATVKFGSPNDEVLEGHPLHGKGLMPYGAHYVMNSHWAKELEEINKVHSGYDPERWKDLRHYLLAFHDEMFECLATGHKVETHRTSMKELLRTATERLMSG